MKTQQQKVIDSAIERLEALHKTWKQEGSGYTAVNSIYRSCAGEIQAVINQLKRG
jgi:hypothetical protein